MPRDATDLLGLAAAPTFAALALLTAAHGGPADPLCTAAPAALPLPGMGVMYALMAVFHSAPWLRRLAHEGDPR
ncbi:MAG: hypothetical protein AB7I59_00250 [Geminicoccaceae bacterium]